MGEVSFWQMDRLLAEHEFKDEKIFGYFMTGQPTVVINDEELAKKVLIKDFDHFTDLRAMGYKAQTKDAQIMEHQLSNLKGEKWKTVRSIMTGVFSSGKLKLMTPHIVKCGEQLEAYMEQIVERGEEIEARNIASLFTMDSLASSAYGLEINSFENPENTFRRMALTLVGAPGYGSSMDMAQSILIMMAPSLAKLLGVPLLAKQPCNFLSDIIEKTYKKRIASGDKRNDIIDVIVEEMNASELSKNFSEEQKEIILVAQAFLLFAVGFDAAAIGISIIIHNLVIHQDVQDELLAEIDTVLEKVEGEVTYEALQEMKYLDMVIQESGRLEKKDIYQRVFPLFSGTIICKQAMKGCALRITSSLRPTSSYQKAGWSMCFSSLLKIARRTSRIQKSSIQIIFCLKIIQTSLHTSFLAKDQGHAQVIYMLNKIGNQINP